MHDINFQVPEIQKGQGGIKLMVSRVSFQGLYGRVSLQGLHGGSEYFGGPNIT